MNQETKKILIVTGIYFPDIGGPASYTKTLANKLSENFKTTVITYSSVRKHSSDKEANFKIFRIWKKIPWLLRHLSYSWRILREAHRHDFILVFSTINGGVPSLLAARLFKKKIFIKFKPTKSLRRRMNGKL